MISMQAEKIWYSPHHENEIAQSEAANGNAVCDLLDAQRIF